MGAKYKNVSEGNQNVQKQHTNWSTERMSWEKKKHWAFTNSEDE